MRVTTAIAPLDGNTAARFRLGRTFEPPVPLVIQPLLRHGETMAQPELLAHFTNTGAASPSLPGLWGGSSVIVDGVSYQLSVWSGPAPRTSVPATAGASSSGSASTARQVIAR